MQHKTIPIFIPELACPHQCVFCNQRKISGTLCAPELSEVADIIESYLPTLNFEDEEIEIGYLGGNFTGISKDDLIGYLEFVQNYLDKYNFKGIRISTRPDYIDPEIIETCKKYRVSTIELGAQSMDTEVLLKSGRGHTAQDVKNAAQLIKNAGIDLGLQMMVGLPGDSIDKTNRTARQIVDLGADNTRIYPTLVIKGTQLHSMYEQGKYKALSIEEAVDWTKEPYQIFEENHVDIIRVGLHPSEGLMNKTDLIDGPFHISFRELVLSSIWKDLLLSGLKSSRIKDGVMIYVNPGEINYAIGYGSQNRKELKKRFGNVVFKTDNQLKGRDFYVDYH